METDPVAENVAQARISRRSLLKLLAEAGAGTAVAGTVPSIGARATGPATPASAPAEHEWCMVIDLRRCDGCGKCTEACQQTHYLSEDQEWIKVYKMPGADGQTYYMPRLCMQCARPPCVRVCPVAATYQNAEGVVLVDQNKCIGCRTCMAACPYEARYFNWNDPPPAPALLQQAMPEFPVPQQRGTVGKCILCVHNTDVGKLPACVAACSMEALYIGDFKSDVMTNGHDTRVLSQYLRDNDVVRYKDELGTEPRVYYVLGHGQDLDY